MKRVIVVGAGAAGLYFAADPPSGVRVTLFDSHREPGVKLSLSGGGRGNVSFTGPASGGYHESARFVRDGLSRYGCADQIRFLESIGLPTCTEGTRVYPASLCARDVTRALCRRALDAGAEFRFGETVFAVERIGDGFSVVTPRGSFVADFIVLAAGGSLSPSAPGYEIARSLGHTVTPLRPALAAVAVDRPDGQLAGLAVWTRVVLERTGRIYEGDLLFTHFGLSGPLALDMSRDLNVGDTIRVSTVVPEESEFEDCIIREARESGSESLRYLLNKYGISPRFKPFQLAAAREIGIGDRNLAEVGKEQRKQFVRAAQIVYTVRRLQFPMVTAGGLAVGEFRPGSMESKLVPGFFAVGEALDVDGSTGGYNIQWAYSSARLAAAAIRRAVVPRASAAPNRGQENVE